MRQLLEVALLVAIVICVVISPVLNAQTLSESRLKRVELTYTRTNVGTGTYTNVRIFIGIPQPLPEQALYSIAWTPEPTSIVVDAYGQPIAEFQIGTVDPGKTVTIRMEVVGVFSKIKWDIIPSSVGELSDIPAEIIGLYTMDGDYYHITDPLIVNTSANVVGGETNPYQMAVLIHDYVAETIEYDNDGIWDDAVTVLNRGTGSCSEYTFLFIALARAAGLPARFAGGSRCRVLDGNYVDQTGHRWAEVYLPNYEWIPFDAQADDVPSGMQATHFGVAAHSHAMIMVRGGGDDSAHMSIHYLARARWSGSSTWERDWNITWTDASIPDTATVFRVDANGNVLADNAFYGAAFNSGSADIAEWVSVSEPVEPGDVVELDPDHPGYYRKSRSSYSTLIAGVISSTPGITMGQMPESPATAPLAIPSTALSNLNLASVVLAENRSLISLSPALHNPSPNPLTFEISLAQLINYLPMLTGTGDKPLLALMGVVPVKATAENGPIKPGDLLTTSSTPGYAMRCDPEGGETSGLIGKALELLVEGRGVIRVLLMAH